MQTVKVITQEENELIVDLQFLPRIGESLVLSEEDLKEGKIYKVENVFHQPNTVTVIVVTRR